MCLRVAPLCDRDLVNVPLSQLAFQEHIVKPCFELLHSILPCTSAKALDHCHINKLYWESKLTNSVS